MNLQKKERRGMKKKIVFAICVVLSALLLAACGEKKEKEKEKPSENTTIEEGKDEKKSVKKRKSKEFEEIDGGESEKYYPSGSNQMDAMPIPIGTKILGKVETNQTLWYAFTTGDKENEVYRLTSVNHSMIDESNSEELVIDVYDEMGEGIGHMRLETNGVPTTLNLSDLEPNTTYYVSMMPYFSGKIEFSFVIRDSEDATSQYLTSDEFSAARGASDIRSGEVPIGIHADEAVMIKSEDTVTGKVKENKSNWFSFVTDGAAETKYNLTFVNKTKGNGDIQCLVYDEYGEDVARENAYDDGAAETIKLEGLKPNNLYYIEFISHYPGVELEYTFKFMTSEEKKKETLVFEKPFEINETQIRFVANKATFVDKEKAIEVLKPVADAILAAPEHALMIAGTTATIGTQENTIELSKQRANAVKDLLVQVYHVPETQIKTVGLGYKLDPFQRGMDIDKDGNFVESEAVKNRRVVILDSEDPIAQKLLEKK